MNTFAGFVFGALALAGIIYMISVGEAQATGNSIEASGNIQSGGELRTNAGVRFADGSLQTTAVSLTAGTSGISGLYANVIADLEPPLAYTEVCFKGGQILFDVHPASEGTEGGNCSVGDVGWIVEKRERGDGDDIYYSWTDARASCLLNGMRLLEPFEWQFSCYNAALFELDGMVDGWEWASNSYSLYPDDQVNTILAPVFGNSTCESAQRGVIANTSHNQNHYRFRCGR